MRRRIGPGAALPMIVVTAGIVLQYAAVAQVKATNPPAFEVSTVKPNSTGTRASNLNFEADEVRTSNLPLINLLQFAYNLNGGSTDQIVGAPSWISTMPFDITAKMDRDTAARINKLPLDERNAALRLMIQELLADRFQMRIHHESRELSVLSLTVAKDGSKLTAVSGHPAVDQSKPRGADDWSGLHNQDGEVEGRHASVKMLVDSLSWKPEIGGRLVVDETGLQGEYNFTLRWTPDSGRPSADYPDGTGPSLFTALQEQLGLKLALKKSAVDCIVIDHAEQPTPN